MFSGRLYVYAISVCAGGMEEDESVGAWSSFWTQVSSCLPCTSRRWRSDDSGADAPILHPPTGNLAECLIPPCAPGLYGESSSDDLPSTKDNFARKGELLVLAFQSFALSS